MSKVGRPLKSAYREGMCVRVLPQTRTSMARLSNAYNLSYGDLMDKLIARAVKRLDEKKAQIPDAATAP